MLFAREHLQKRKKAESLRPGSCENMSNTKKIN